MLQELTELWPREQGNGWFKPKVHEQLHVPCDIQRNGSPRNTYGGTVEHNHVGVKNASKRTQQRRNILDKQIGDCCAETQIVDYCYAHMMASENSKLMQKPKSVNMTNVNGTQGKLTFERNQETNNIIHRMEWQTKTKIMQSYLNLQYLL